MTPADGSSALVRRPWLRGLLLVLGWGFTLIGIVGLFLPLLPGTVFLIAAAACFTRSSPRFEAWLLAHPRLGPPVRDWRAQGAIPRHVKGIACASLAVSWLLVLASDAPGLVKIALAPVLLGVAAYIVTRPLPAGGRADDGLTPP